MTKNIFKGFKQVSSVQFEAAQKENALNGYIWFVRTAVLKGEEAETGNDVANDSYDIYFGSRHYGHFCEGEIKALEDAINGIRTDLGFEFGQFELGEDVKTVKGAFDAIVDMIGTLTDSVSANTESIGNINTELEAKADKSELEAKADKSELEAKADKTELEVKADKVELDAKADKTELEAKADKTELEVKADKTELEAKADKTELEAKADKTDLDAKVDKTALADYIADAKYEGTSILFKNADGETIAEVDATPFVKDGILDDVEVVVIEESFGVRVTEIIKQNN